jgi:hypothetical protein
MAQILLTSTTHSKYVNFDLKNEAEEETGTFATVK